MNIPPDDPRLTAYVLEELEGAERDAVGTAIHHSEALYQEAAAIRDTAQWLLAELQASPRPGLAPEQVVVVQAALEAKGEELDAEDLDRFDTPTSAAQEADGPGRLVPWPASWRRWLGWFGLAAACVVGGVWGWRWLLAPARPPMVVARNSTTQSLPQSVPPPAWVTEREVPPNDFAVPTEPTVPPEQAAAPEGDAALRPMTDIRMMMRYGLLPKGYRLVPEDSSAPPGSLSPPASHTQPAPTPVMRALDTQDQYRRSQPATGSGLEAGLAENPFHEVFRHPLSTFGLDADTASYSLVRQYLGRHQTPPRDVIRIEELINYFPYDYASPTGEVPIALHVEIAGCPWAPEHRLVRLGLKARGIAPLERPPCNLVFLIDVSGSMAPQNRLPLLKQALRLLVEKLSDQDSVALVVYASDSRTVLPPTPGSERGRILAALDGLQAGGSTHGSAGIQTAYQLAAAHFRSGGVNRVVLCTDGDFNVGITDRTQLAALIADQARTGVFLTVLGFGMGNFRDGTVETLADRGNGNYAYVDTLNEAHKVLVEQLRATLVTVAKDVKVQVEFNPAEVHSYRLLGYENRALRARDFNDDRRDGGELGAGHQVTVLYEIVPAAVPAPSALGVDPLRYQSPDARRMPPAREPDPGGELLTLKLRYKAPEANVSERRDFVVRDGGRSYAQASADFRFAASVAAFGMILRDSMYRGSSTLGGVIELAGEALGTDPGGYRAEFVELVQRAQAVLPGR